MVWCNKSDPGLDVMETKFDKLRSYQKNKHENASDKAERRKKKSAKTTGLEITGLEGQGMIKMTMSGICSTERWEKIFGKKDTKAKGNKKTRSNNK